MGQIDTPTISCVAKVAGMVASRRVKFTRNASIPFEVEYCGAGENHDGITQSDATADLGITVALKNKPGTHEVTAAGTFTASSLLYGAADGKVDDTVVGQPQFFAIEAGVAGGKIQAIALDTSGGGSNIQQIVIPIEDLAAGGDIADRPVFVVPDRATTLISAGLLTAGAPAGVDDDNTAVVALADDAANAIVSKTYNTANQPPTSGYESLGTLDATHKILTAGEVVKLSITQGTTANLSGAKLILVYA